MRNYLFFIGCDVSKAVIDISYYFEGQVIYLGQFSNSVKGFKAFARILKKTSRIPAEEWFVCFENTGVYSKSLLNWLVSQGISCREENALKISKSLGLRRGKNDKIDSEDICLYAYEKRDSMKPTVLAKPLILKLKTMNSRRDFLIKQKTALVLSLKEQKGHIEAALYKQLNKDNDTLIKAFSDQIKTINTSIQELIDSDEETKINDDLARSVIGIGPVTSAQIIAVTENYTLFKNPRKFACYTGVAPFPNQSGIRKGRNKVSQMANKKLKSLFSNCAMSAIVHDPDIREYYNRKIGEGKRPGIVINAVKNKLIQRLFCVINRQIPYAKIRNYA